jgi:hypothetical protein
MQPNSFDITMRTAAAEFGMSDIALARRLRELHVLDEHKRPTAAYRHQNLFKSEGKHFQIPGTDRTKPYTQLLVTPRGMGFLHVLFGTRNEYDPTAATVGTSGSPSADTATTTANS